jgi:hypothetical protein
MSFVSGLITVVIEWLGKMISIINEGFRVSDKKVWKGTNARF